jgi:homoserine O-acetyltransferase/O-succinyltransferase
MSTLNTITFPQWQLASGKTFTNVPLTYQVFGPQVGTAPVVVVNHALTGNSNVAGEGGWWGAIIGDGKAINTRSFTVVAFNIPGNGYGNGYVIKDYKAVTVADVAALFWQGLDVLGVGDVFAIIGGSLGGGLAWHMAALQPERVRHLIPVATDHKATDWVIANVLVQDRILNNSINPLADARLHAMLLYRTPQSFQERFNREQDSGGYAIEGWLEAHGKKLQGRFTLPAYRLMNHLLKTIDVTPQQLTKIEALIRLITVNTDLLFTPDEVRKTFRQLIAEGHNVSYHEINSMHGHDAFLIENKQLESVLAPVFSGKIYEGYVKMKFL